MWLELKQSVLRPLEKTLNFLIEEKKNLPEDWNTNTFLNFEVFSPLLQIQASNPSYKFSFTRYCIVLYNSLRWVSYLNAFIWTYIIYKICLSYT